MPTGRPKAMLTISSDERTQLVAITRSRSLPAALTSRAKIVLACEREPSNAAVATELGVGPHTIGKWRNRFIAGRIEGLYDEMRSGRPRTVEDEAVAELITKTLARKPKAATHWSVRAMARETGIAKSTVHRLFQLFGLQPHRTRSFKLSTDPFRPPSLHRLRRRCHSALFEASQVQCSRPTSHWRTCPSFGCRLHEPVRHAVPDAGEASQVPYKGRLHMHGVSDCARLLVAKPLRREDVAFRPTVRRQHLEIRPVSQLDTQPVVTPVNASS